MSSRYIFIHSSLNHHCGLFVELKQTLDLKQSSRETAIPRSCLKERPLTAGYETVFLQQLVFKTMCQKQNSVSVHRFFLLDWVQTHVI